MTQLAVALHEVSRAAMQRWLPQLDAWLLPGSIYSVQHTWPQLYRSDGGGRFFVATDGERLLSHCAFRTVELHGAHGRTPIHLLGSVATDPDLRGQGLASAVLDSALAAADASARHTLLWAERPELYARAGFAPGRPERCLTLLRRPRRPIAGHVRPATIADHATLHALHEANPLRVERSPAAMSGLLTTPGLSTLVLERDGAVVAYACTGKGADLHGFWHELGGSDEDLAELLPAALHALGEIEMQLLLPPYRHELPTLLGAMVAHEVQVPGPMVRSLGEPLPDCWIDGLDSV
ncbi:MAG: GNAT family N-acetyltransferase [Planctomycetes bacterium]|nr:GNAT family N-acetyltransferase [Planctomycetota bacterium]